MDRNEIQARLTALRERVAEMAAEVGELVNASPYGFGSRISYVADRLQLVDDELAACLAYPQERDDRPTFRVDETDDGTVTVWHNSTRFGFRFKRGDTLARYTFAVLHPRGALSTAEGMATLDRVRDAFLDYAREHFPQEFKTTVH